MGCWVYIDKHIPKEEEVPGQAAGGKKPPPAKGKAPAGGEEQRPQHSKAWLNLTPFLHPGTKSLTQRIMLAPVQVREMARNASQISSATPNNVTNGSIDGAPSSAQEVEDIYSPCQSYVYLTINLSEPLFPEPSAVKTDSSNLLLKFKDPKKFPGTKDAIATYESAIKYIVGQVGQEYQKMSLEDDTGAKKKPNGPGKGGQTTFLSTQ